MAKTIGPSHHDYYGFLHRRSLWLQQIAKLQVTTNQTLPPAVQKSAATALARFPHGDSYPRPLDLSQAIDDTPVESFLANLEEELLVFESNIFSIQSLEQETEELVERARLWGRSLGQDVVLSERYRTLSQSSLIGIYEVISFVLNGGSCAPHPFLRRRYTARDLQYEVPWCPHHKDYKLPTRARHLACLLDAQITTGFIESLLPGATYERTVHKHYCLDTILI